MNYKVLAAGLVVVVPLLILLAVSFGRDPHHIDSPLVGRNAPVFTLGELDSEARVSLASLRGKPVVLNFWATWCVPCVQEHRVLHAASTRYAKDVQFIGIVYEDQEVNIRKFLARSGSGYPTLIDEAGKTAIAYGVYGVPETFFIDAKGTIVEKHAGPLDPMSLEGYLQKVVSLQ